MPTRINKVAQYAAEGCLVKPLLLRFFLDTSVEFAFDVRVTRPVRREFDGWFHASSHPVMSDRELYLYMTEGTQREELDYISAMSVMFGTVVHGVVQEAVDRLGIAVPLPADDCPACGLPRATPYTRATRTVRRGTKGYCWEHGACDQQTRSRGHLDAILNLQGIRGFDLKTIRPLTLMKTPDMDLEFFRQKWPGYYAQAQEYMRITGLRKFIVFFMALGNPWEMREYQFDFDPVFAYRTEQKYLRVLKAIEGGVPIIA